MARASFASVLASLALVAGCAAPAGEDAVEESENELRERIPVGTYALSFGPTGTLDQNLAYQDHVTRLSVLGRGKYEAEVMKETPRTTANPFFPWLTLRTVERSKRVLRGTMTFVNDRDGKPAIDLGSDLLPPFPYTLADGRLELTSGSPFGAARKTVLRLDPTYRPPAPPAPIELTCVGRHVDRGDTITVALSDEQNTARIRRASSGSEWPSAGPYGLAHSDRGSSASWREYVSTSGSSRLTLRFPIRELEARSGSFDAAGSYYVGDVLLGGDYHLSLRCTHR